jgi:Domain of unknown function (DUF4105)
VSVRFARRVFLAWVLLCAPALGAQSAEGDSLQVYLLTIGQGDEVWERFGHNAIGIRDLRAHTDIAYNWGLFDFQQPGFVAKFVRGDMLYWMAGNDAAADTAMYVARNRSITIQELNLSPNQRATLLHALQLNAREENKFYHYDYFRDNCSTRVRDALDNVLAGALRRATENVSAHRSYRRVTLALMAEDPVTGTGIDIGLGRPADREISVWEEMFIPMRMRDRLRRIQVADASGQLAPLVTSERLVFEARRPPEAENPPNHAPLFLALSTLIGALFLVSGRAGVERGRVPRMARVLIGVWSVVAGLLGAVLVFLRLGTHHVFTYGNLNLLQYNPLWVIVALLVSFAAAGTGWGRAARVIASIAGALTVLAMVIACIPGLRQDSLAVLLLAAPANLAAAWVARRTLFSTTPVAA